MKVPEGGEVVQLPESELDFDNDTLRGEEQLFFGIDCYQGNIMGDELLPVNLARNFSDYL